MISAQYAHPSLKCTDPQKRESRRKISQQPELVKFSLHGLCIKHNLGPKYAFLSWYRIWFFKLYVLSSPLWPSLKKKKKTPWEYGIKLFFRSGVLVLKPAFFLHPNHNIKSWFCNNEVAPESQGSTRMHENNMVSALTLVCKFIRITRQEKVSCWKRRFRNSANIPTCNVSCGARESEGLAGTREILSTSWSSGRLRWGCAAQVWRPSSWARILLMRWVQASHGGLFIYFIWWEAGHQHFLL